MSRQYQFLKQWMLRFLRKPSSSLLLRPGTLSLSTLNLTVAPQSLPSSMILLLLRVHGVTPLISTSNRWEWNDKPNCRRVREERMQHRIAHVWPQWGQGYSFISKEEFLGMVEREELLEYMLVYSDYKGMSKQQIRECLAKGCNFVLRVDI